MIHGYVDADYAGCPVSRKSTIGYLFTFAGGAISWVPRLQGCITISTTEVEYVAATKAAKEAIWLSHLLAEFGMLQEIPVLHCNS